MESFTGNQTTDTKSATAGDTVKPKKKRRSYRMTVHCVMVSDAETRKTVATFLSVQEAAKFLGAKRDALYQAFYRCMKDGKPEYKTNGYIVSFNSARCPRCDERII